MLSTRVHDYIPTVPLPTVNRMKYDTAGPFHTLSKAADKIFLMCIG